MTVAVHTRLWRRLHHYQDTVMEAQCALLTEEVPTRLMNIEVLQAELWRRFRGKLARQAPGLLPDFDQLAIVEAEEDHETYRALAGEKECDGHLVFLNVQLDHHKAEVQRHPVLGGEAA